MAFDGKYGESVVARFVFNCHMPMHMPMHISGMDRFGDAHGRFWMNRDGNTLDPRPFAQPDHASLHALSVFDSIRLIPF